jgi:hypothetical protein
VKIVAPLPRFVYFLRTAGTLQPLYPIENTGKPLGAGVQIQRAGAVMIIFILTFAIVALFAITLTGSLASATRRRS